jgi:protein-S-isoprenylcysteine O-methyltransferase Ste14
MLLCQSASPGQRKATMTSRLLVGIQFLSLAVLGLSGPLVASGPILPVVQLAGIAVGVWAIATQGIGNFNVRPDPVAEGRLVTTGPYRVVRHPMYAALFLAVLPVVIQHPSFLRWAVAVALIVDIVVKISFEERLLRLTHSGYAAYCARSWKLIPLIY